jgi:hypothetical protein
MGPTKRALQISFTAKPFVRASRLPVYGFYGGTIGHINATLPSQIKARDEAWVRWKKLLAAI